MSDIFISYARDDSARAELLAKALLGQGWSVWWDRTIPAGSTFGNVIERELADARCVLVLWSRAATQSHWVLEEAEEGRKRGILIPAFIESVEAPMGYRSIQGVMLLEWKGNQLPVEFKRLVTDLAGVLGPPPKSSGEKETDSSDIPARKAAPVGRAHRSRLSGSVRGGMIGMGVGAVALLVMNYVLSTFLATGAVGAQELILGTLVGLIIGAIVGGVRSGKSKR